MSEPTPEILPTIDDASVVRASAGILAVCALITAWLLGLTYAATRDRIEASQRLVENSALLEVVNSIPHDNDLLEDTTPVPPQYRALLNSGEGDVIHVVRDGAEVVGFIIPATAPDGYSGAIDLIVGLRVSGEISGVRVVSHAETPGLGDRVEPRKSPWILGFAGLSLGNPPLDAWTVRKDGGNFDAFTGATITPRAVVTQVAKVLRYYRDDRSRLLRTVTPRAIPTAENTNE